MRFHDVFALFVNNLIWRLQTNSSPSDAMRPLRVISIRYDISWLCRCQEAASKINLLDEFMVDLFDLVKTCQQMYESWSTHETSGQRNRSPDITNSWMLRLKMTPSQSMSQKKKRLRLQSSRPRLVKDDHTDFGIVLHLNWSPPGSSWRSTAMAQPQRYDMQFHLKPNITKFLHLSFFTVLLQKVSQKGRVLLITDGLLKHVCFNHNQKEKPSAGHLLLHLFSFAAAYGQTTTVGSPPGDRFLLQCEASPRCWQLKW